MHWPPETSYLDAGIPDACLTQTLCLAAPAARTMPDYAPMGACMPLIFYPSHFDALVWLVCNPFRHVACSRLRP